MRCAALVVSTRAISAVQEANTFLIKPADVAGGKHHFHLNETSGVV